MIATLETLWTGDHVLVNGQHAMYNRHCMGNGWWLEVWLNKKQLVLALPDPPQNEREYLPATPLKTLELIAKPDLYRTDNPLPGDWFYIWYALEKPNTYIFWDITGPHKDGTYTMYELKPWEVERYRDRPKRLTRRSGWTNYVKRENGTLHDKGKPIPFFKPPFLPSCLRLPPTQLKLIL